METARIALDWNRLLGFDHCRDDVARDVSLHSAKVGSKVPGLCGQPNGLVQGLSAKGGAKQMLRRAGEIDRIAMSRLTKVGIKTK
jgi:hypothetical protein